jgi:prepilin-type N-terminal cleavage/methylation domain-containing protein
MGHDRLNDPRGFTLVEVLVAALLLVVGVMGTLALVDAANARSTASQTREAASNLAREVSEYARTIPFAELQPSGLQGELQSRPGLADATPGGAWDVVRRKRSYTVSTNVCSVDTPGDGYGVHGAGYCPSSSATGTTDGEPEDLKRVSTAVTFTERGRSTTVRFASTFSSRAQSTGLPVLGLLLKTPTVTIGDQTEPVIDTAAPSLTFEAETPATAARVVWSVDGVRQPIDASRTEATRWRFTWAVTGLSDGTYLISAQAVDAKGEIGPPREMPVVLARLGAPPPTPVAGGFNTVFTESGATKEVAELRWIAASERNVTGYRVYRPGITTPVCETSASAASAEASISCLDLAPPREDAPAAERTYGVRSLYRDASGTVRQSAAATSVELTPRTTATTVAHDYKLQANLDTGGQMRGRDHAAADA